MTKQSINWIEVLKEYQASGLKRKEFYSFQGISFNKFKYHLYRQKEGMRLVHKVVQPLDNFEPIKISGELPSYEHKEAPLAICLPNKIRCEVQVDISSVSFLKLLEQLVCLC